jgi:hypothetical protein
LGYPKKNSYHQLGRGSLVLRRLGALPNYLGAGDIRIPWLNIGVTIYSCSRYDSLTLATSFVNLMQIGLHPQTFCYEDEYGTRINSIFMSFPVSG